MTPFLTCPRSTRAPDRIFSHPQNPVQNTSFRPVQGESGITGGLPPLSPAPGPGGGLRGPRAALPATTPRPGRYPSPLRWKLVALARHSARDPGCAWTARPALRRLSWTPKRAANCPLPHRRDGGATAHVSPLAQSGPSLGLPGPENPQRVGQRRGKGPGRIRFPLPRNGRGRGRRPLLEAPAPRFPERRAEITPSPRGSDLGTWAGLQHSAPRPRPLSRLPARIRTLHPKVPRPEPGAGKAAVAGLGGAAGGDSTCPPPRQGGRRGAFGSPPSHSLPETSPFGSLGSAHATTPLPPLHPSLSPGVSLGRSRAFRPPPQPRTRRRSSSAAEAGCEPPFSRGNPET